MDAVHDQVDFSKSGSNAVLEELSSARTQQEQKQKQDATKYEGIVDPIEVLPSEESGENDARILPADRRRKLSRSSSQDVESFEPSPDDNDEDLLMVPSRRQSQSFLGVTRAPPAPPPLPLPPPPPPTQLPQTETTQSTPGAEYVLPTGRDIEDEMEIVDNLAIDTSPVFIEEGFLDEDEPGDAEAEPILEDPIDAYVPTQDDENNNARGGGTSNPNNDNGENALSVEGIVIVQNQPDPKEVEVDNRKTIRLFMIVTLLLIILAIISSIVLYTTFASPSSSSSNNDSVDEGSMDEEDTYDYQDLFDVIVSSVSLYNQSTALVSFDELSPQHQAIDWLVQHQQQFIDISSNVPSNQLIQRYALAVFYFATGGEENWQHPDEDDEMLCKFMSKELHECQWIGTVDTPEDGVRFCGVIGCDRSNQITRFAVVNGMFLDGTIPSEIALLTHLEDLSLFGNTFISSIPKSIGLYLHSLTYLNLQQNSLVGSIPTELALLSKLEWLLLNDNALTGTIPKSILTNMPELGWFNASYNQLEGSVSLSLAEGDILPLQYLSLASNQLTGTLPTTLGQLSLLKDMILADNEINGTVPTSFLHLTSLENLVLARMDLNGDLTFLHDSLPNLKVSIADCLENDDNAFVRSQKIVCEFCSHCCNETMCYFRESMEYRPDWNSFFQL